MPKLPGRPKIPVLHTEETRLTGFTAPLSLIDAVDALLERMNYKGSRADWMRNLVIRETGWTPCSHDQHP